MLNLVLIAGGMGTRMLKHFPDTPKLLLPLTNDKTILSQLLEDISADEYYFCLGNGYEKVTPAIADVEKPCYYHVERSPKGTFGALKEIVETFYDQMPEKLFVLLGDLYSCGFKNSQRAEILQLLADDDNYYFFVKDEFRSDSDRISVNSENLVTHLYHKNENSYEAQFTSRSLCGAYLLNKKEISACPLTTGDLVTDYLPHLIKAKSVKARILKFDLLDVGTIERYNEVVSGRFPQRQNKAVIFNLFDVFESAVDLFGTPYAEGPNISKTARNLLRMVKEKGAIAIAICCAEEVCRHSPPIDMSNNAIDTLEGALIADGLWFDDLFFCTCSSTGKGVISRANNLSGCECKFCKKSLLEYLQNEWNCDVQNILSFTALPMDLKSGSGCQIKQYKLSLVEKNSASYLEIERFLSK